MSPIKRRLVYATSYEIIAVFLTGTAMLMLGHGLVNAGVVAIATSLIAMLYNLAFTWVFETWEARNPVKGRTILRRIAHAVLFEIGLCFLLVPLLAFQLNISFVQAFITDIGLIVFFLFYTFVFNIGFDKLFGLPASAAGATASA
jgi:uncharacterized membrane protein